MNVEKKHVKFWVLTEAGEKKAFYSDDFVFIPPDGENCYIIPSVEIDDTIKRNQVEIKKLESIYKKCVSK